MCKHLTSGRQYRHSGGHVTYRKRSECTSSCSFLLAISPQHRIERVQQVGPIALTNLPSRRSKELVDGTMAMARLKSVGSHLSEQCRSHQATHSIRCLRGVIAGTVNLNVKLWRRCVPGSNRATQMIEDSKCEVCVVPPTTSVAKIQPTLAGRMIDEPTHSKYAGLQRSAFQGIRTDEGSVAVNWD